MASPTARTTVPGSGGKIVRPGRTRRTPYDRPPLRPRADSSPEPNPNWLSRLILSPTRMLATGAGKVLSSVFGPDSDADSSSCDSDSEDDDVVDNDDDEANEEDYGNNNVSADGVDENNHTPHRVFQWRSQTKRLISQLLTQETFSREECNILTEIIKSRVVDSSIAGAMAGSEIDMNAIVEAKRWLEEKKNSRPELEHGICTLNTAMTLDGIEGEMGSPVDLAKSYMRSRPPWASPSVSPIQYNSPSLQGGQLFKQDSPYYFGGNSSKLYRESPASGSWSILEEVRKVRAKATEEMLKARPSSKIDSSSLALHLNRRADLVVVDGVETVPPVGHDGLQCESPDPAATGPGNSQDLGLRPISQGTGELSYDQMLDSSKGLMTVSNRYATIAVTDGVIDNGGKIQPLSSSIDGTVPDSRLLEQSCSRQNETIQEQGAVAANGFTSGSSLSAAKDTEGKSRPSENEHDQVNIDQDEMKRNTSLVESHKQLGEDSVEVQVVYANENAISGLQNSSSKLREEKLSKDPKRLKSKRSLGGKASDDVAEKLRARKVGRYSGRGRGRGK